MNKFKTNWKDAVFSFGEILFILFLLPSLLGPHKPAALTSIGTAAVLYTFAAIQTTYNNIYAAALLVITASLWVVLSVQVLS